MRARRWGSETDAIHSSLDPSDIVLSTWGISTEKNKTIRMHSNMVSKCTCLLVSLCSIHLQPRTNNGMDAPLVCHWTPEKQQSPSSIPPVSFEINCAPNFTKAQQSAKLLARSSNQCFFFLFCFFFRGRRKKIGTLWDIVAFVKDQLYTRWVNHQRPKRNHLLWEIYRTSTGNRETEFVFLDLLPWKCCFFVQRFSAIWHKNLQGKRAPAVPAWQHVYLLSSHHYRLN